ncbi:unnamed protein product [Somion occarium]|uniref:Uncharacterized protein n=1 Tax=Somion occarium TaxID=3059160 RepID=A0ABP1E8G0_9APHY
MEKALRLVEPSLKTLHDLEPKYKAMDDACNEWLREVEEYGPIPSIEEWHATNTAPSVNSSAGECTRILAIDVPVLEPYDALADTNELEPRNSVPPELADESTGILGDLNIDAALSPLPSVASLHFTPLDIPGTPEDLSLTGIQPSDAIEPASEQNQLTDPATHDAVPDDFVRRDIDPSSCLASTVGADDPELDSSPAAMHESPPIRLAYLHAVLGNIFEHNTILDATNRLAGSLDIIDACGCLPTYPKPVRTLVTAKKQLGLNVDDYIKKRPICIVYFKYYSYETITSMDSPQCTESKCQGLIYRDVYTSKKNHITRLPAKIQPYASIIKSLRRLCLRKDFIENLIPLTGPTEGSTDDTPMTDFYGASASGTIRIGLKCVVDEQGKVKDIKILPGSSHMLRDCELGLSLTLNVDW